MSDARHASSDSDRSDAEFDRLLQFLLGDNDLHHVSVDPWTSEPAGRSRSLPSISLRVLNS